MKLPLKRPSGLICGLILLVLSVSQSHAADTLHISAHTPAAADSIQLFDYWVFKAGDDPAWADPAHTDDDWAPLPDGVGDAPGGSTWQGIGWFRVHLHVDSSQWGKLLGLTVYQMGASEVYLNGRKVVTLGQVGTSAADEEIYLQFMSPPSPLTLAARTHQVIAIRYSHFASGQNWGAEVQRGLIVQLREYDSAVEDFRFLYSFGLIHQILLAGISLTFCLIHLFVFVFYRRLRANLYFALFTASTALLSFAPGQLSMAHDAFGFEMWHTLFKISIIGTSLFGLWFSYNLFYDRPPRLLKPLVVIGTLLAAGSWVLPRGAIYAFSLFTLAEWTRAMIVAVVHRKPGWQTIGFGYLLFGGASAYQMLLDFGVFPRTGHFLENYVFVYGLLVLLFSMSIYLAWQFARVNLNLEDQLEQVQELSEKMLEQERAAREQVVARKLLEQEVDHKKKELEEAKKLEQALAQLRVTHQHLKDTQTQLVQSEKMASLGMLVAGVAHEINTPVGAISSMHETLVRAVDKLTASVEAGCSDQCDVKTQAQKPLKIIADANRVIATGTDRVTDIVRRLKSFARLDEAELKRANINEGLEDTLTLMHHELKHCIDIVRDYGDIPEISCYPAQLNQVFLNLLVNGRQAIKDKGTITVRTRAEAGCVKVEIADTGQGIPADKMGKIFDPGFTTKGVGVGTGLGLSICYQIIETHRGRITVESEEGRGTTFTITLPTDLDLRLGAETA